MIARALLSFAAAALVAPMFAAESVPPDPVAAKELSELEDVWVRAENTHDAATLRQILSDQFIVTSGAKQPRNRDEFIAAVTAGEVDPTQSQTLSDRTIRIDGDTAVVVETDTVRGTREGKLTTSEFRITTVYLRRHGRWLALGEHAVRVPPPAAH